MARPTPDRREALDELVRLAVEAGFGPVAETDVPDFGGVHASYDGSERIIHYLTKDGPGAREHTVLHEMYEIVRERLVAIYQLAKPVPGKHLCRAANRFAAAVLLQPQFFSPFAEATGFDVVALKRLYGVDYFNLRQLPWKGEKDAVRYWTSHDPGFLRLFMECIKETDPSRRVALLGTLCASAASPTGSIWDDDHTGMHLRPDAGRDPDIAAATETALDLWDEMVGRL